MNYIKEHKNISAIVIVLISIILISLITILNKKEEEVIDTIEITTEITTTSETSEFIFVDIKGAIKKPGVYKVTSNSIVNDVIKLAGGLKSNASTTNINLSKKVTNEMVIYIFTKNELKTTKINPTNEIKCETEIIEVNNCIKETTTTTNKVEINEQSNNSLININTASKEELMTLTGVGASKADAIIVYRTKTPFVKIEDLMNVSGIGESAFAKIKDYITV